MRISLRTRRHERFAAAAAVILSGAAAPAWATPPCPADFNGDGAVNSTDISAFLTAWLHRVNGGGCPAPPAACPEDINEDGVVNSTDISAFLTLWLDAVNSGGCPSEIQLMVTPTSGGLGTLVSVVMTPALAPDIFDASTRAEWIGTYTPLNGVPTPPFTVSFNASEFREVSASQASVVLGSGSVSGSVAVGSLDGIGVLQGTLNVFLSSGRVVAAAVSFQPDTDAGRWRSFVYITPPGTLEPPLAGPALTSVPRYRLSQTPDPLNPTVEQLNAAIGTHLFAEVRVAENPESSLVAPSSVLIEIASFNASGTEVDRVVGVSAERVQNDGDPAAILYRTLSTRPVILVDVQLAVQNYPQFTLLRVEDGGSVAILPSLP